MNIRSILTLFIWFNPYGSIRIVPHRYPLLNCPKRPMKIFRYSRYCIAFSLISLPYIDLSLWDYLFWLLCFPAADVTDGGSGKTRKPGALSLRYILLIRLRLGGYGRNPPPPPPPSGPPLPPWRVTTELWRKVAVFVPPE